MTSRNAYIIAARRSALGRIGGLHRNRRIEDLAVPVLEQALADANLAASQVDDLIIGNASQGSNPARLIALAAGLPPTTSALTLDRQCASGLDAVLAASRAIELGEASVVIAGGAESLSTAPWRIAKPRRLHQVPHFIGVDTSEDDDDAASQVFEAVEDLSKRLGISREQQDAWAWKSHQKAAKAYETKRLLGEIVPLRKNAEEVRDETAFDDPDLEDLSDLAPYYDPNGTLTPGNTSSLHDGAAFVVIVDQNTWEALERPPALRLMQSASCGVGPDEAAFAPIQVVEKLYGRIDGFNPKSIGCVELSETSAAQAIAFSSQLGLDDELINADGGALVRGHPFGAAGAVLVVRLFTTMCRVQTARGAEGSTTGRQDTQPNRPQFGVAALGARGGLGLAALFEAVGTKT
ncbi:MAG: thiolase family protein [Pseudomonadota bacterium]